ncbi:hypothetical protein [Candidatus Amarobacter glycogenicus]|uniref:hypothetical protein n=1 Tax=Candidatus Amarobacter glycogenicus TaxID=3140699 RepID=UPI002A0E2EB1|nr:hypothetical protein [Dehalococcoidia bacterium]
MAIGFVGQHRDHIATAQGNDDGEDLQGEDGAQNQSHLQTGPQEGQDDVPQPLPEARAKQFSRFQHFGGNGLQAGNDNDHHNGSGSPLQPDNGDDDPITGFGR